FDTIAVFEQPYPIVDLGNDTLLCNDATLILDAKSDTLFKEWQNGSNQNTYTVSEEGTYSVNVIDEYGCATLDSIHIEYQATPIIELGNDSLYCYGDSVILIAFYPDATYIWNDGSTDSTYGVFMKPGSYHVDVSNQCGYYSDSIKIDFHNCISCVNMPNVFTPNYDGLNDVFKPIYDCNAGEFTMKIFNRWGQLIFQSTNIEDGWDGTFNGRKSDMNTYVWHLTYQNMDKPGVEYFMEGNVTLLR
ncbi:MAG: gliding motility-associated C-terminal domain-containing protein, partial [Chitinophagales bacterium]|nr:gliding motility-associated C-terminal domain-containing protein [Chitinophagales bacterium]